MAFDGPSASLELARTLESANAALTRGDTEAANIAMTDAADLCGRMQAAGLDVLATDRGVLRDLADRCGVALTRLGEELNAERIRDDNQRRGLRTYGGEPHR